MKIDTLLLLGVGGLALLLLMNKGGLPISLDRPRPAYPQPPVASPPPGQKATQQWYNSAAVTTGITATAGLLSGLIDQLGGPSGGGDSLDSGDSFTAADF